MLPNLFSFFLDAEATTALAILIALIGAPLTALFARRRVFVSWLTFAIVAVCSLLVVIACFSVLQGGHGEPLTLLDLADRGDSLRFAIDGLAALFLLTIVLVSLLATLFSVRYMEHYADYSLARYTPQLLLFFAGMLGIVAVTDMLWWFCLFWQLMTIPSFLLVRFEYREPTNTRAALKYLVMMELACAAIMLGGYLLSDFVGLGGVFAPTGLAHDFETVARGLPLLMAASPRLSLVAFILLLLGFGIKAGIWPFGQIWLPDAHPAAPSPISAMLSGVMIKTGVFGLLRVFLNLTPLVGSSSFPLAAWGTVLLLFGLATLTTGTLQALKQEQSKRLLAFHSIGQIGYIVFALGAALLLLAKGMPVLALIALIGGLFHVVNHALFKSLLFLNAGMVLGVTGSQNLNHLGGLFTRLPLTALTALVAAFSIAGVPLLNGFVSKWTIYTATLQGGAASWLLPLGAVLALIISAFTLASFVKFYGVIFLARPSDLSRQQTGRDALDTTPSLIAPQLVLAALCLLFGLMPQFGFTLLQAGVGQSLTGLAEMLTPALNDASLETASLVVDFSGGATFTPLLLLGLFLVIGGAVWGISRLGGAASRQSPPWLCGYAQEAAGADHLRYSAHHYYFEIKRYLRWLGGDATGKAAKTVSELDSLDHHRVRLEKIRARRDALLDKSAGA